MMDELRWVHTAIRRDLAACVALAERVRAGADVGTVREGVRVLRADGLLWQLRMNCLHQCATVHMHHRIEDTVLFRQVRAAEPALGPTLDRLEADHRVVSDLLDRVEVAAEGLAGPGDAEARPALSAVLEELSAFLLAHLDTEEAALEPVLSRLER
jgi:hypothetical protein